MHTTRFSLLARLGDHQDSEAWREFDAIYRPMLHRFAGACGVAGAGGDDLVQECMTAIVQHIERFKPHGNPGSFRAWLRRMVVNRVLNKRRDCREVQGGSAEFSQLASAEPGPDEIFDEIYRQEQLRYCLTETRQEVEASTYEAFRLHVLEEQPVESVCRLLQMTPNQLYKIKWRVTRKVAEKLEAIDL